MPYDSKKESCPICNKQMGKRHLGSHINHIHQKIKDYGCDLCESRFTSPKGLQDHKSTVHNKELNHKCKHCGKCFGFQANLSRHVRSIHKQNIGCVGAYSDVSKVQKVLFFRQHFDKHDKISAWLKFQPNRTSLRGPPRPFCVTK